MTTRSIDAVIVGAGIMGVSTAYHLARRWIGRVVVVERDGVCAGSTALASGGIRHQYANRIGIGLTCHSIDMHGPIAGQLMAELIADGRATTVDITPLALDRFARGEITVEPLTFT